MKKIIPKTIKETYEHYMRLKKLGKLEREIARDLGLSKELLQKIIRYHKEKK